MELSITQFSGILLKLTLRGLHRTNKHAVRQAAPMKPETLIKIRQQLNLNDAKHAVFWAMCTCAFWLIGLKSQ